MSLKNLVRVSSLMLALCAAGSVQAQTAREAAGVSSLFVDSITPQSTSSQTPVDVTGLNFNLPASSTTAKFALITLTMPNLYLSGTPTTSSLGGTVSLLLSGVNTIASAQISNDVIGSGNSGRKAISLVVKVSLLNGVQSIQAVWSGVRGATINTDTFSSLSAVLTSN